MIVTLIPYCPKTEGKNLGFAYNELMARLREDDWACFLDHDACFTTPDWYAQLEEITGRLAEPCVLTATTNRVGSRWQLAPGADRRITRWSTIGVSGRMSNRPHEACRDVTNEPLMSGVVISCPGRHGSGSEASRTDSSVSTTPFTRQLGTSGIAFT